MVEGTENIPLWMGHLDETEQIQKEVLAHFEKAKYSGDLVTAHL